MTVRQRHAPLTTKRRTYSHLEGARRIPDEYDIATSKLLYYVERGFEVKAQASDWYERYQKGACLKSNDWDSFVDPRRTTYSRYVALQRGIEAQADGIVNGMEQPGYDERLRAEWVEVLGRLLGPLRYALHGLQMAASYVGSMAPSGRIVIAVLFQAADEMRRIQRITQRLVQLGARDAHVVTDAKVTWMKDPAWQPLRELVEKLLVRYDWAEAFVALNCCVKPVLDRFLADGVGSRSLEMADPLLGALLRNLEGDASWHRAYTRAVLVHALASAESNRGVLDGLRAEWGPRALAAVAPLGFALGESAGSVMGGVAQKLESDWSFLLDGGAPR